MFKIRLKASWSEWGDFNSCSETCGGGQKKRLRNCLNIDGSFISIYRDEYSTACNTRECPTDNSCQCDKSVSSCKHENCGKNELCNIVEWYKDEETDTYKCQDKVNMHLEN